MPRTRPPYPEEFRREAIELVRISSKSQRQIAEDLGISDVTLRNWVKQAERDEGKRPDGLSSDEREELHRLRRENQTLRMEREILKKAAAFFARETAEQMGLYRRRPECGLIHHSDQGCQYTAVLFSKRCAKAGIEVSMGSIGDCYDNAVCETFHATLKKEKIYRQSWPTRAEARAAVFAYIEAWYNPRRRHSTLEYLSPAEFERQHAGVVQTPLDRSISGDRSAASIALRASDALTTDRISTVAIDFAADSPISSETALTARNLVALRPRRNAVKGRTAANWPSRSLVKEEAR